jgi:hypothetical protein
LTKASLSEQTFANICLLLQIIKIFVNVQKIFFFEFCLKLFTALKFDIVELQIRFVVMDDS